MANDNFPMVPKKESEIEHDFSDSDLKIIAKYVEEGLPGIAAIDEPKMFKILDLYLSGKTYRQITMIAKVPKAPVLFLSQKYNWFSMKQDYQLELEKGMHERIISAKISSQDFLINLTQMWEKKISSKISMYLSSDNELFTEQIDLKEIDKYLKTIEVLHKLSGGIPSGDKGPAVGLNLGSGVTISKTNDGAVEITPHAQKQSDVLKKYAEFRRDELKQVNKEYDISKRVAIKKQGETEDEDN